ncbi:hypothetical protein HT576_23490 [Haloterrigena sp. SYSU A121-1]|uniref:Rpa-associated protein n=1 Tax=Haloterrigena gelatinilytica TaxID=2741724 RepID=A0A8J8KHY5_9EURY|nr:hypothetical protein [Haloterrigena gelatinilytica]NUB93941.1 hypothetical protein [Haloterrigena gelatinilytica]
MSANGNGEDDEEIPGREVAYRLFAAEYDDASFSYAESDEERAPNYVISPTGARLNRVFAVGTLTEITAVNDEMVRARVVDPTGAFVVYAGQYQPDELATLERLEPPEFVAVTGKARTFQPDDSDQVYTSLRPESIATVDADTRDRWVVSAAEQTVERVGTYAAAAESDASGDALTDALLEAGVDKGLAAGIPLAQDHYGTTSDYLAALRDCALEAVEVVAGERDQVEAFSLSPEDSSPDADASFASLADLVDLDLEGLETPPAVETESDSEPEPEPAAATAGTGSAAGTATSTDRESSSADVEVESDEADAVEAESETETETETEPEPPTESTPESADPAAETTEATPTGTGVTDAEADATADVAATDEPSATDSEPAEADAGFDETDLDESETTDEATEADVNLESDTVTGADLETGAETDDEDLGDFDVDADDVGDGGMYEMDEEEREQLEAEFGAEFTTGAEVEEPGEADIDVPEPDDEPVDEFETESEAAADAAASDEAETESTDDLGAPPSSGLEADAEAEPDEDDATAESAATEPAEDAADDSEEEPADVDLEDYVVETMEDIDDGDGADRTELVERVADETGADESEVEDAIQDALMGGQCYEPDDETLKAI